MNAALICESWTVIYVYRYAYTYFSHTFNALSTNFPYACIDMLRNRSVMSLLNVAPTDCFRFFIAHFDVFFGLFIHQMALDVDFISHFYTAESYLHKQVMHTHTVMIPDMLLFYNAPAFHLFQLPIGLLMLLIYCVRVAGMLQLFVRRGRELSLQQRYYFHGSVIFTQHTVCRSAQHENNSCVTIAVSVLLRIKFNWKPNEV